MHVVDFAGYTFPQTGLTLSPHFGDTVPRTRRLPGLDGGFDEYGTLAAPHDIGNVALSFTMTGSNRATMQAQRDDLLDLSRLGVQMLRWKSYNEAEFRHCWARINAMRIPQRPSDHTDLWQNVNISFQVSDARWFKYPFGVWYLDGGTLLDGSDNFDGWATSYSYSIDDTADVVLNIDGTADTFPVITFQANTTGSSGPVNNFVFQRLDDNGILLDKFSVFPTLADANLRVDCKAYTVQWESVGASPYDSREDWLPYFDAMRSEFFRLSPGNNILRAKGNFTNPLDFVIEFTEDYR